LAQDIFINLEFRLSLFDQSSALHFDF